jgi:predicted HTH transcriptional regulator
MRLVKFFVVLLFLLLSGAIFAYLLFIHYRKSLFGRSLSKRTVITKKVAGKGKVKRTKNSVLNERQEKLLKMIKSEGHVSLSEIESSFRDVSNRTLRRDFDKLELLGYVEQLGRTKNSIYKLLKTNKISSK